MSGSNPLQPTPRMAAATKDHPASMHARVWQHVNAMPPHEIPDKAAQMDALLPVLGGLAGNPNVKAKDVIKAAADAAASKRVSPSEAVEFISQMPTEPDKLQPWLRTIYAANLSAQVHMKAAMAQQAQAAAQPAPAPVAMPQGPLNG